jgi:hypothetical protein
MTKVLWEGEPVTITVDPAGMTLSAYDDEKIQKIREDYKGVKILSASHIKREWDRRWKEAKIANIEGFDGGVEILTSNGAILGSFSGSDEYGGQVNNVWKITTRPQKEGYPGKIWQLWTSYSDKAK